MAHFLGKFSAPQFPHCDPYHFICYPLLTHPSPSYMGMSINRQRKKKFTFWIKMQSMQKTLILMQIKKREEQGRGMHLASPLPVGMVVTEWSEMGSVGRDKKRERHLLNQSLVVDKFSKTSTWHHSKQTNRGGRKVQSSQNCQFFFTLPTQLVELLD